MAVQSNEVTGWAGWIYFAAFMMVLVGIFQMIAGLTALLNDQFFLASQEKLLVFDITQWGWVHMVLGLIILMAGTSLFNGRTWARVVGTILVMFNLISQFAFVNVYPIWSVIMMIIDVLVIYALTVHGRELRTDY